MAETNPENSLDELKVSAQRFLNQLCVELYKRTTQPVKNRSPQIGILTVIHDPEQVQQVLHDHETYLKNFGLVAALGKSRFNTNGADWTSLRARTQPFYSKFGRSGSRQAVEDIYTEEIGKIDVDNIQSLETALARGALRVFFLAFGLTPNVTPFLEVFKSLREMAALLQYASWTPGDWIKFLNPIAISLNHRFFEICENQPEIAEFVLSQSSSDDPIEQADAVTDFMTNMFAGIETSTAAMMWSIIHIGKHEEAQNRLHQEVTGGSNSYPYLTCFVHETLRSFPPIPFVVREVAQDTQLGPHDLKAGSQIMLSVVETHRSPDAWSDPQVFHASRPEFMSDATPDAFIPFLTGPRVCGGRKLAELELIVALKIFVETYRVTNNDKVTPFDYSLALRPRLSDGLVLERRS